MAKQLYEARAGKWMGCNEQDFLDVLAMANQATCNAIAEAYEAMGETEKSPLFVDIEKCLGSDLVYAVIAHVKPRKIAWVTGS